MYRMDHVLSTGVEIRQLRWEEEALTIQSWRTGIPTSLGTVSGEGKAGVGRVEKSVTGGRTETASDEG
jgi:hypothetical protein